MGGPCLSPTVADHPLRPAKDCQARWAFTPPTTTNLVENPSGNEFNLFQVLKKLFIPDYQAVVFALRTRSPSL